MTKVHDENGDEKFILGEATPVRIGIVILFLGVFAGAIWWASNVNSKLDSIITFNSTANTTFVELKAKDASLDKDISDMKLTQALMEVSIKELRDKIITESNKSNKEK